MCRLTLALIFLAFTLAFTTTANAQEPEQKVFHCARDLASLRFFFPQIGSTQTTEPNASGKPNIRCDRTMLHPESGNFVS